MDDLLRHGLTLQGAEVRVLAYLVEHTYGSVLEGARTPRLTAHLLRQAREGALWLWPDLPVAFANAEETEAASELPPVQVSLLLERPATSHREAPSRMILVVHLEYQSSPHDGERLREACRDAPWQGRVLGAD